MTADFCDAPAFLFHSCDTAAWAEIYEETGQYPPDSELTRRRAYRLYEDELRRKNQG